MRGKHPDRRSTVGTVGLIPAHAGKTASGLRNPTETWAHPRACGENADPYYSQWSAEGSSPRMRGKQHHFNVFPFYSGLIPAHAGKTSARFAESTNPRGSSPRMRGKREPGPRRQRRPRLIPAHAGKTRALRCVCVATRAHPRACGENFMSYANF